MAVQRLSEEPHEQRILLSERNGLVGVDALCQSRERHPGGGILCPGSQSNASHSTLPCDRWFNISSASVGLLFTTITLALWSTVTICWNGFIAYKLASGLQCD